MNEMNVKNIIIKAFRELPLEKRKNGAISLLAQQKESDFFRTLNEEQKQLYMEYEQANGLHVDSEIEDFFDFALECLKSIFLFFK